MKVAIVRGKFLNRYEMQFFAPLIRSFDITAFGSFNPYHDQFPFPVVKLPSPMDLPEFPYKMPILNRLFTDAHYLLGLEEKLKGFDLVHSAETYFRYTQQCLNAKKSGYVKKVIATVLENIPFNNEGIHGRKDYKVRARHELDYIIALTKKTRDALILEGMDSNKITVISHFVDTKRFVPDAKRQKSLSDPHKRSFAILYAGRLEEYKGVFDLIDAVSLLERDKMLKGYDVTVRFVGMGSEFSRMQRKTRGLLKNWHSSYESATYDEMLKVYQEADIFVAPSRPTSTWEEQYCTALLEAQAAGLPIVTTRSGGIPENVGDAAVLVPPGDTNAIARSIKEYLVNPHMRMKYAQRARRRATAMHDISIGAKKMAELYRHVLTS